MGVLDELTAVARADADRRAADLPLKELRARLADAPPVRDPLPAFAAEDLSVIAEVKRSSPSKGALAEITDPAGLASAYARGGAAAISVLTERTRFNGSLADLAAVRAAVDVPVLRKDFTSNEYQLVEARVTGADLALLIVAALTDDELAALYEHCLELGLTPLVEVHTAEEIERALRLDPALLGVNNRNLQTLEVHPEAFAELAPQIPDHVIKVAESGLQGPADAAAAARAGARVVLVGEALVTGTNPEDGVAAMIAAGSSGHEKSEQQ
ncbi:indole-3-glycerol phosphate synthase TrpC [Enemella sp. A6]|uniref:indole-3-glycerol phosphate synthase TrpC n=1 Tax=Enemella sp. A6 TaxID=3440152 RepID=UPI003EBC108E